MFYLVNFLALCDNLNGLCSVQLQPFNNIFVMLSPYLGTSLLYYLWDILFRHFQTLPVTLSYLMVRIFMRPPLLRLTETHPCGTTVPNFEIMADHSNGDMNTFLSPIPHPLTSKLVCERKSHSIMTDHQKLVG